MKYFLIVAFLITNSLFLASCERVKENDIIKKQPKQEAKTQKPKPVVRNEIPISPSTGLPSFADLVKKLKPAVVNISTTNKIKRRSSPFSSPFDQGHPFDEFFKRFFEGGPPQEFKQRGLGTGFIISKDGFIVTNNHVIEKADDIEINLEDGEKYEAKIIGKDPKTDLALLKIDAERSFPFVEFGDSEDSEIGDWVIAIGNPFGLGHTVTAGIISAKGRILGIGNYDDFIQTDAPINPGNSGGPLFNLRGEVVGVNTAIIARGQGLGFSIPVNLTKHVIEQIKESGRVVRGWLGISIQKVTPEIADVIGVKEGEGVLVADVMAKSPAQTGGLARGDIILEYNGEKIKEVSDLTGKVALTPPGDVAKLKIIRDKKTSVIDIKIGEFPEDEKAAKKKEEPEEKFGLVVVDITPKITARLNLDSTEGVIVNSVARGSAASEAGFRRGDIIVEINRVKVQNVSEYNERLDEIGKGNSALFLVNRGENMIYIGLKID
ncbi:MAG: Do family serine endopeptidase [Candidatus Dadabacteria bacterium]|nr:DegQ family serine endoprotease [Candidatus Dadabacteria bacterium]NIX15836.1 Do family serine endopeptidase [Candidatus Dadabacteria bacterium]NIY22561.1 Do family serine endopeptidase [Candidatus Dadabacteria bacterium]